MVNVLYRYASDKLNGPQISPLFRTGSIPSLLFTFMREDWKVTSRSDGVGKGNKKALIPAGSIKHTLEQSKRWGWVSEEADEADNFVTVPAKRIFIYRELGRFAGWPANNGIWSWGDEILVGFATGYYQPSEDGHSIDQERPSRKLLARSLYGGETWRLEDAKEFDDDE
jgi:hypothetical protein